MEKVSCADSPVAGAVGLYQSHCPEHNSGHMEQPLVHPIIVSGLAMQVCLCVQCGNATLRPLLWGHAEWVEYSSLSRDAGLGLQSTSSLQVSSAGPAKAGQGGPDPSQPAGL